MARSGRGGFGWLLVGVALGVAATLLVERRRGPRRPDPLHGIVRRVPGATPGGAGRVARLARQALRADPVLAELGIRVVPVAAGAVELHGWVATRALRARALRTVREAPMVDRVMNHLLVRGEDDTPSPDATPTSEQTA